MIGILLSRVYDYWGGGEGEGGREREREQGREEMIDGAIQRKGGKQTN